MTEPKNPTAMEPSEPLPGLDLVAPVRYTPLEHAARRTLAALRADGLVDERHALTMQLVLDLAQVAAAAVRKGQASAAAMASAQILAALESLTPETEGGDRDAFDELADDLRRAANMGATGSSA